MQSDSFNAGLRLAYLTSAQEIASKLAVLCGALNVPLQGARRATANEADRQRLAHCLNWAETASHALTAMTLALDELGSQPILPAAQIAAE